MCVPACVRLLACHAMLCIRLAATQPSFEATAKVKTAASAAFASDNGAPRQKKQKDERKVGSGFKSKKRFKRR